LKFKTTASAVIAASGRRFRQYNKPVRNNLPRKRQKVIKAMCSLDKKENPMSRLRKLLNMVVSKFTASNKQMDASDAKLPLALRANSRCIGGNQLRNCTD
jgi:hypothetical protein